ncbi:hypothetical protein [Burkholderia pseudomallei]|uniref:hypothetical protein n=1 Tax=Burkholderia pseudomallei TaxID=28450 RepID=UPI00014F9D22|nr:hypothetical protein [Burkholderia pseudomallei]AGR69007.1 hypothetical protein BDL_3884 [Burkholderia pseudomallei MSHR305]AHK68441.1 hypothetical protein BBX_5721 [Burkholderia pseudomallei MSHR520]AIP83964.1 hypothetical protein JE55_5039 [Burkholderia pseudomallei]APZ23307.1 hypothetical protein BGI47_29780 [Burkholderia pseudomallei]APZ29501.1 hypothetical protein BGI46_29770 [Burkholderia pseudomallei]
MLDADPTVFIFCERPGYVQVDGHQHLADFRGCYVNLNDLVILNDSLFIDDMTKACHDLEGQALSIPRVASAELAATRTWIDNRHHTLPCVVATVPAD